VGDEFQQGACFSHSKIKSLNMPPKLTGLMIGMFFIKHCDTATNSFNDIINIGDMAEGLMMAFNLQNPLAYDLGG
jgi:hypothetical protein